MRSCAFERQDDNSAKHAGNAGSETNTHAQQLWVGVPLYYWSDISLSMSSNCYILNFGEDQLILGQSKWLF